MNNHKHDADIPWASVNSLRTVFFAQFVTNDLPTNFMGMYIAVSLPKGKVIIMEFQWGYMGL